MITYDAVKSLSDASYARELETVKKQASEEIEKFFSGMLNGKFPFDFHIKIGCVNKTTEAHADQVRELLALHGFRNAEVKVPGYEPDSRFSDSNRMFRIIIKANNDNSSLR